MSWADDDKQAFADPPARDKGQAAAMAHAGQGADQPQPVSRTSAEALAVALVAAMSCGVMMPSALRLATLLCVLAAPGQGQAVEETALPGSEAEVPDDARERRCTADGAVCISQATYAADVCRAIESAALAEGLDAWFFARLLWRESLFDAGAVSPAGAQGIAQFMPGTAALRGLRDPFNPAEAIGASAAYLKELEGRFGNLGLAAAAYNAGEARVERFLAGAAELPGETRAYVYAITDAPAFVWRQGPLPQLDLALDPGRPFQDACLARAERRQVPSLGPLLGLDEPSLLLWAVVIAGRDGREAAEQEVLRLRESHDDLLGDERVDYTHERFPGMLQRRHFAQVGRDTRVGAEALCERLSAAGAGCAVRRNRAAEG